MPNVTLQAAAALSQIVINVFVPKKGQRLDYKLGDYNCLGGISTAGQTDFRKSGGTLTINLILNDAVTSSQVQDYLRSIAFSTSKMDPAKKPLGRRIDVQLVD